MFTKQYLNINMPKNLITTRDAQKQTKHCTSLESEYFCISIDCQMTSMSSFRSLTSLLVHIRVKKTKQNVDCYCLKLVLIFDQQYDVPKFF